MANDTGLAVLAGLLGGLGEGALHGSDAAIADSQKAADLAERKRQADLTADYHNRALEAQNYFEVTPEQAPNLGIPAGRYHKDVASVLVQQAKEKRANDAWNTRMDEALKGNRETTTIPGTPAVPEQPIETKSTSEAVRSRMTPAQPEVPARTETRVKNPELDALMNYLRPLGPEAGGKALSSPDVLSTVLGLGRGNTQETKQLGDTLFRLTYDRNGNVINQTPIGPAQPTMPKSVSERYGEAEIALRERPNDPAAQRAYDVAKSAYERELSLATAKVQGTQDVMLDQPLSPKDRSNMLHPQTMTPPAPNMTKRQVIAQGYMDVDDKDREAVAALQQTKTLLTEFEKESERLNTATTALGALTRGAAMKMGAATGVSSLARLYDDRKASVLGVISRSLGGERGVLTDRDIDRIARALPGFSDTAAVARAKMETFKILVEVAEEARRTKMFGGQINDRGIHQRIDDMIERLEHGAPSPAKQANRPAAQSSAPSPNASNGGRVRVRDTKTGRMGWAQDGEPLPAGVEVVR